MSRSPLSAFSRNPNGQRVCLAVVAWIALCCLISPPSGQAGDRVDDPYPVFVASDSAHLRCGPAGEYYRTDPLRHGQELEVYVESKDGWLGVRPTEESFCWVVADAIEVVESDPAGAVSSDHAIVRQGEVTEDRTVAWIGTNLGRARRYRWQVQLSQGEPVTILGSSEREGADGPQTWYRIVPPSGEFRWIHRDQVVTTAEELVATLKPPPRETTDELEFIPAEIPSEGLELADVDADRLWRSDNSGRSHLARTGGQKASDTSAPTSRVAELKNLSQRIGEGLSVLIRGRDEIPDLEPVTRSSRRIPDLVSREDVSSRFARAGDDRSARAGDGRFAPPMPSAAPDSLPQASMLTDAGDSSDRIIGSGLAENPPPMQSQLSIASRPRMVPEQGSTVPGPSSGSGWNEGLARVNGAVRQAGSTSVSAGPLPVTPASSAQTGRPTRTISSAEIEEVQRQIAKADPSDLGMLLSKMMARAASAPEIGLVAEAAERIGDVPLAARARQYQTISRRRDGDTMVQTASLSTPVVPAPSIPSAPHPSIRPDEGNGPASESTLAATPRTPEPPQPAARPVHEGTIVEVYSADPHRPPFALTDQGGRTIAYVTPAPGLDLRTFLGGPVRVVGETGYLQKLRTAHILATEVQR